MVYNKLVVAGVWDHGVEYTAGEMVLDFVAKAAFNNRCSIHLKVNVGEESSNITTLSRS